MLKARLLAVGLGVLTVFSQTGFASDLVAAKRPYCPCPPGYARPVCPPGHVAPGHITPAPVTPAPSDVHPNDLPSDNDPNKPETPDPMVDPMADPNVPPQDPGANIPPAPTPSAPTSAPSVGTGLAGSGGGATTPMLGRLDASNRLNIFDNQTAIPRSRVWFAYQNAEGIDTGIVNFNQDQVADFNVYRLGLELAITEEFSVSMQGQHVNPYGVDDGGLDEDWTDPQLLFKYVVYDDLDCCCNRTVVSATLGFQIEVSNSPLVLDNDGNRIYPGMLFYKEHNDKYFSQGGMQVGISTEADPYTFDWSYALGYWAYKHPLVDGCCCCDAPFVIGVAPQIGILGKHVWGDNDFNNPFRTDQLDAGTAFGLTGGGGGFVVQEARHVLDVTAGATILMQGNTSVGVGYSFPITNAEQRRGEFIASLNWYF